MNSLDNPTHKHTVNPTPLLLSHLPYFPGIWTRSMEIRRRYSRCNHVYLRMVTRVSREVWVACRGMWRDRESGGCSGRRGWPLPSPRHQTEASHIRKSAPTSLVSSPQGKRRRVLRPSQHVVSFKFHRHDVRFNERLVSFPLNWDCFLFPPFRVLFDWREMLTRRLFAKQYQFFFWFWCFALAPFPGGTALHWQHLSRP